MSNLLNYFTFAMITLLFVLFLFILFGWRWMMKRIVKQTGKIILSDSYQENIMELMPGLRHMGIQNMLENSLRAETGHPPSPTRLFKKMAALGSDYLHTGTNITISYKWGRKLI